jgi:hexosaminidase
MNRAYLLLALLPLVACTPEPAPKAAGPVAVIPAPVSLVTGQGNYVIKASTPVSVPGGNAEAERVAGYFTDRLARASGMTLPVAQGGSSGIQLALMPEPNAALGNEGYELTATSSGVKIAANTDAGLFYGVQTLIQLLPDAIESDTAVQGVVWSVPAVTINDYPRFGYRGLMLDVSRHFYSKEYVMSVLERMARYKLNRFHWHLTDDNGWRIEIKSLPKLTGVGAWRVPRTGTFGTNRPPEPGEKATYGGFYTQDEIREVVQYARERNIEVMPEVDVPGHSMAALASYPELSVTNAKVDVNPGTEFATWYGDGHFEMHIDNTMDPTDENTYAFLDKVFGELAGLFPYQYMHIGGDECYHGYWERDPGVKAFMKKNNLKTGMELQGYFSRRLVSIVESKGKKAIGWDELLEGGVGTNAAIMSWRGTKGGIEATQAGHPVVMSPSPVYYLDMMQGDRVVEAPVYNTARLKEVYAFDILVEGIDSAHILGGQGNMWTEQTPTTAQNDYMMYPRALAIAESLWSPRSARSWDSFTKRLEPHLARLDRAGVNYSPAVLDPIVSVKRDEAGQLVVEMETELEGLDVYWTMDNAIPDSYHNKYTGPVTLTPDADFFKVISYWEGKPVGRLMIFTREQLERRAR